MHVTLICCFTIFRNGNGISLCARTERKATRKEANSALDQFADKVKEVRKTHNNLPITLIVFLLGHFNEGGCFCLQLLPLFLRAQ